MSLPKKDMPLDLTMRAHTVLSATAKTSGAKSLKAFCEAILEREAERYAMAARYLAAQMEANGIDPSDWERDPKHASVFSESGFGGGA